VPTVANQQPLTPQQQHLQQTQAIQQILQSQMIKQEAGVAQAPSQQQQQPTVTAPVPQPANGQNSVQLQAPNLLRQMQQAQSPKITAPVPQQTQPQQPQPQKPQQHMQQPLTANTQQSVPAQPQPVQQTPPMQMMQIKKEVEENAPQTSRENTMDIDNNSCDNLLQSIETSAADLKKLKRRQYQQKRRQSAGKEGGPTPKKRSRKLSSTSQSSSKVEEDYDSFIEHLMPQLRQLPSLNVLEPELGRNFAVCPIFGSGDLAKLGLVMPPTSPLLGNSAPSSPAKHGDLVGTYGKATLPNVTDYYHTKPFGKLSPIPPVPPVSSQRGFYDQEFAPLKLESEDANRDREDSPDTVVSSSSPECFMTETPYRFPGLRLIKEEDSDTEDKEVLRRASPVIPLVVPTPVRVRPSMTFKDVLDLEKENVGTSHLLMRNRWGSSPTMPLRETGNVTVTLTLNTAAARDVEGALSGLARLLRLPTPLQFSVADTTTQSDYKLGVYKTRNRDGEFKV